MKNTIFLLAVLSIAFFSSSAQNPRLLTFDSTNTPFVHTLFPPQLVDKFQSEIAIGPDCRVYVGTYGAGLAVYDGTSWEAWTKQSTDSIINNDFINSVMVSEDGTLWVGHSGQAGLLRWRTNGAWNLYTKANTSGGLAHSTIRNLAEDKEGNIWVGTEDGVSRFKNPGWNTWNTPDIPNAVIQDVDHDAVNDETWVATSQGAAFYNGTNWTKVTEANGLPDNFLFSFNKF
ncbi:MAG: hypothetical protein IH946_12740 [Bacteroidetes bacterium]|nr:hypothetical protein [Bacteroidota bacterium]